MRKPLTAVKFISVFVLCLTPLSALAQTSLVGVVKDDAGNYLEDATVIVSIEHR